jgi:uncharacterized protein
MTKTALLIFTRVPIPGQTKTRLIPLLGAQGAADFHQTVLHSTLLKANASDFETVEIWCTTKNDHPFLKQCRLDYSCTMKIQQGNDLGERMHNATDTALAENALVVLIGSDCPAITTDIINRSYQHLYNGKDAVLGPTKDGGYYLIGLNAVKPEIFQDIIWGQGDVAERTRHNFTRLGLDYAELEELIDIDTPGDYQTHVGQS